MPDTYTYILASWGNPFSWSRVRYVVDERAARELSRGAVRDIGVDSTTSLAAAMAATPMARGIVFLPETVALPYGRARETYKGHGGEPLDEVVDRVGPEYAYPEAMKCLRRAAENYIEENVASPVEKHSGTRPRVTLYLVPNTGNFPGPREKRYRWVIERGRSGEYIDVTSLYAALVTIYSLREMLRDNALQPGNRVVIIVDITHGINYMPLMIHRAAETLAYTAAAVTSNPVDMVTLNSEPYSTGVKELRIHVAEKKTVEPREASMQLVYMLADTLMRTGWKPERELLRVLGTKEEIASISRRLAETARAVASKLRGTAYIDARHYATSIYYNLPLALLQTAHLDDDTEHILHGTMEALEAVTGIYTSYEYSPKLVCGDDGCEIKYIVAARYEAAIAIASMMGLRVYGKTIYNAKKEHLCTPPEEKKIICAPLTVLMNILENNLTGPINPVSRQEISILLGAATGKRVKSDNPLMKEIIDMLEKGEWYREIPRKHNEKDGGKEECSINKRNFVAHAGLSTDAVGYLVRHRDTASICYRRECVVDKGKGSLLGVLLDLFREIATGG